MEKRNFNKQGSQNDRFNKGFNKTGERKSFNKDGFKPKQFGNKKPFNKGFKKPFKPSYTIKEGVVLPKETIMELRCTNTDFFNDKIMTLGSYTAGTTGKFIKAGDLVAKCKWKLAEVGIENKEGKVMVHKLNKNSECIIEDFVPYLISYIFKEVAPGKYLPKLFVQTPDDSNLKKIKYISLKPFGEITGTIKVRETEVIQNEEPVKKLIVKFSQESFNKLKSLREYHNIPSNAQLLRHLIDRASEAMIDCAEAKSE